MKINIFWNPDQTDNRSHNITAHSRTVSNDIISYNISMKGASCPTVQWPNINVYPQNQEKPDFDLRDGGTSCLNIFLLLQ